MGFSLPKRYQTFLDSERNQWDRIQKAFSTISSEYEVTKTRIPSLTDFEVLNDSNSLKVLQSYHIKKDENQFTLCVVEYQHSYEIVSRFGGRTAKESHKYLFGFLNTHMNCGRAYLRPEKIGDSISEYFSRLELDIKGFDTFNKNYYLVVSDKPRFLKVINKRLLTTISAYRNIEMEFTSSKCLFRMKKVFELDEVMKLCELGIRLSKCLKNENTS